MANLSSAPRILWNNCEPAATVSWTRLDAGKNCWIAWQERGTGLIMTMGKGGVGKTSMAVAIATELANRGHPVHLSTTDPAAHIQDMLDQSHPNLQVSRIDPKEENSQVCRERS